MGVLPGSARDAMGAVEAAVRTVGPVRTGAGPGAVGGAVHHDSPDGWAECVASAAAAACTTLVRSSRSSSSTRRTCAW